MVMKDKLPIIITGVLLIAIIAYAIFFADSNSRPLFSRPAPQPVETPEPQMITDAELNDQIAFEMVARAVESARLLVVEVEENPENFEASLAEDQTTDDVKEQLVNQFNMMLAEAQRLETQVRDGAATWHQAVLGSDLFKNDFEAMKQIAVQQRGLQPVIPTATGAPVEE